MILPWYLGRFRLVHRYRRHEPEKTALCPIVEQHLAMLTGELTRHHVALPAFVVDEFPMIDLNGEELLYNGKRRAASSELRASAQR